MAKTKGPTPTRQPQLDKKEAQNNKAERAELAEVISDALPVDVLKQLVEEVKTDRAGVIAQFSMSYSAPIPQSAEFGEYDRILPGSANRILAMAEAEQAHRHNMDAGQLDLVKGIEGSKQKRATLGLTLGTLGLFLSIAAAVVLTFTVGSSWTSTVLGGGGLLGVLQSIVMGGKKDKGDQP